MTNNFKVLSNKYIEGITIRCVLQNGMYNEYFINL